MICLQHRGSTFVLAALTAMLAIGAGKLAISAEISRSPNIVLIFTDDHGWSDLGCHGVFNDLRTPHIDRLAAGGVRMTSGYVTAPQCVPSRAGLLTGKYQPRFGVESNGQPLDGFDAELTIAQRLKQAGYATGMTGKWHLGPAEEIRHHGFDHVYCTQGRAWANVDRQGVPTSGGFVDRSAYHLDANTAAATAFIKRHHDKPFFYYLSYRAPHVPLDAPAKYLQRFPGEMPERRRQALAMLSAVDDGVGAVLRTLREHDIEEQTLIFFISDNGAPLKIHKLDAPGGGPAWDGSLNDPMNGEKGMLTEGGIRVPYLVSWKGTIPAGQVYHHPVISLDVAATAAALAGLPHDPQLDGVNLLPHLTGEKKDPPHQAIYWRWIAQSAVREGKWKYLRGGQREYLFDLDADREETHSLLKQHPEVAGRLRAKLAQWAEGLDPPGLATGPMSATWEQYFDHYLDGKLVPRGNPNRSANRGTQGWVARNGTVDVTDGVLHIAPRKPGDRQPFIACSGLNVAGPATATIQIRSTQTGKAGFAWRLDGQKDFPANQTVRFEVTAADEWQEVNTKLPARGRIIHLRLLLPEGPTSIRRISIESVESQSTKQWLFERKE